MLSFRVIISIWDFLLTSNMYNNVLLSELDFTIDAMIDQNLFKYKIFSVYSYKIHFSLST